MTGPGCESIANASGNRSSPDLEVRRLRTWRSALQVRSPATIVGVLFFVAGDFFGRRRKQPRPTDEVPLRPLVDFVAFWVLLSIGAFAAAVVGFALYASTRLTLHLDRMMTVGLAALGVVAIVCLERAMHFWWRMR